MKHVRDISDPKIGMYVRYRIGYGARESEVVEGQVKEALPVGDQTAYVLDNGEVFNFYLGDRLERITAAPPRSRGAERDDEEKRKTVWEREHYRRERAHLRRERDIYLMFSIAMLAFAIVYVGVRDGAAIVAWLAP